MMTIYLARPMHGSPFSHRVAREQMEAKGIRFVTNAAQAQVIVSHNIKTLMPYRFAFPWKRFLIWTNEPRYDTCFSSPHSFLGLGRTSVMNVYTGNVFWNNLHFLGSYHFNPEVNLGIDVNNTLPLVTPSYIENYQRKATAAFFSFRGTETACIKDGLNIDLEQTRIRCALAGKRRGILDIYGKNWPTGMSSENSGYGVAVNNLAHSNWWDRKIELLGNYHFNLCLENTAYGYYCTEKIWHAIISGCLPIYHGKGTNIYETFPKHSFIDCADYPDCEQLFDAIESMSLNEYVDRRNACIQTYNNACAAKRNTLEKTIADAVERILSQIYSN
jgi:hypothetical protein